MANIIEKLILNGNEYEIPSGSGGDTDVAAVNAIVDANVGNYDSFFQTRPWLYKLINWLSSEDDIGLTEGENWEDIVANTESMSTISHGYTVMSKLACSEYALGVVLEDPDAIAELMECWNSCLILFNNERAANQILNSETALDAILNSETALDALLQDSTNIETITTMPYSTETWEAIFNNSTIATYIATNTTCLTNISNNHTAFDVFLNTTYWTNNVWNNITRLNIFMGNWYCYNAINTKYTSAELWNDTPLRSIIQNNKLDSYLNRDDRAKQGVIIFDITVTGSTTGFKIPRYWYGGSSYAWKYSLNGGSWSSLSGSAATSVATTINLAPGNHTIVLKPQTYGYNWARCLGNRNSTNYWTASPSTLLFSIRNLPGYAFMSSSTDTSRTYFMAYNFYNCTSLTEVKNFIIPSGTSAGNYYMYYMFYGCTHLTKVSGRLLPTTLTTAGSYFMYYMFGGCTSLKRLPSGFNLSTITSSISTYFMAYFCYNCSKLEGLPTGMKLPPVGNSSSYMYYAFYGCSLLNSNSPAENLTFINAASYCFTNTGISTASPSAGSNIAVHRV